MTAQDEPGRMRLSGYVPLTSHGFAIPAYRVGPGANAWYVAKPGIEGDHISQIKHFQVLEGQDVLLLNSGIEVAAGDPWQDVFLWADRVFAGIPAIILQELSTFRDDLQRSAPLSLLDLVIAAQAPESARLAAHALSFLETRLGAAAGAASFRELVLRPGILLELHRQFHRRGEGGHFPDFVRDFSLREYEPGRFETELVPGTAAVLGDDPAMDGLASKIDRFGDVLGLSLRISGFDRAAPVSQPSVPVEEEPPTVPPPFQSAGHSSASLQFPHILVIATGPRAATVARYLQPPRGVSFDGNHYDVDRYRISKLSSGVEPIMSAGQPVIHIADSIPLDMTIGRYGTIVWLAGDEALQNPPALESITDIRRHVGDISGLFLTAPIPPADGPSIMSSPGWRPAGWPDDGHAIIDTTLARSPFWTGQSRRSIDRRMADIISTVMIAATLNGQLRERVSYTARMRVPPVLSLYRTDGSRDWDVVATPSELVAPAVQEPNRLDGAMTRVSLEFMERLGKTVQYAFLDVRPLDPDFQQLVAAAIMDALDYGLNAGHQRLEWRPVPKEVKASLRKPWASVAVRLPGEGRFDDIILTGEAPDLKAVRETETLGMHIARYTDRATIKPLFRTITPTPGLLPAEIHLPKLHRYVANRGLATRGLDTRDVLRVPRARWEEMLAQHARSGVSGLARRYLPTIDARGLDHEIALPIPAVKDALLDGDPLAVSISEIWGLSRHDDRRGTKRVSDLTVAWSRPFGDGQRWVIEDGQLPVEAAALEPEEVPAQQLFIIDGDGGVPILLMSRLFTVWAKALLPSSTSWSARFQVGRTFDAFPIPRSFRILPARDGSPPQLRLAKESAASSLSSEVVANGVAALEDFGRNRNSRHQSLRGHTFMQEIDRALLSDISLPPDASDLDILERLIDLNRRHL